MHKTRSVATALLGELLNANAQYLAEYPSLQASLWHWQCLTARASRSSIVTASLPLTMQKRRNTFLTTWRTPRWMYSAGKAKYFWTTWRTPSWMSLRMAATDEALAHYLFQQATNHALAYHSQAGYLAPLWGWLIGNATYDARIFQYFR